MAWYGLASKNACAGSAVEAIEKLNGFWEAFAETNVAEKMLNFVAYSAFKVREVETPVLGLNAPVFSLDPRGSQEIYRERLPLSLGGVAASGTLPEVRQAGQIAGRYYWDGLYSLNPPIREFWEGVSKQYVPAEI